MSERVWFVDGRRIAKARRVRCAVESMLEELCPVGSQLVTAELARSAADLVDSARSAQDPRLWLQASTRLEKLLGQLQGRAGVRAGGDGVAKGGDGGAAAGVDAGGADPKARLEELVGRAPSVGDEA